MAQSRLERIGTIFSRTTNLIKGGVLKEEDLPIWYAVYKAFPPKYEPKFDRPGSQVPVKDIFYPEDFIRGKFQEEFQNVIDSTLTSNKPTLTQEFIAEYQKLEKEGVPEPELYVKAREKFVSILEKDNDIKNRETQKPKMQNQSKMQNNKHIQIKDIFAESN